MAVRVDVACCFDAAMALPAAVLAASIARATRDAEVTLHLVHLPGARADAARIVRAQGSARFCVACYEVAPQSLGLEADEISFAPTYLRLALARVLPVERVIYLDCDTVVLRSLRPLAELDLGGAIVAAVGDHYLSGHQRGTGERLRFQGGTLSVDDYVRDVVQLPGGPDAYCNAGVVVVDLAAWRAAGMTEQCLAFTRRVRDRHFHDQDAINHLIQGRFVRLDPRWNALCFAVGFYQVPGRGLPFPGGVWGEVLAQWRDDPWIVHFAAGSGPWRHPHTPSGRAAAFWRFATPVAVGVPHGLRLLALRARVTAAALPYRRRHLASRLRGMARAVLGRCAAWLRALPGLRRLRPRSRIIRAWRWFSRRGA